MQCPRCQQVQEDGFEECRHCGVVFARYRPRPAQAPVEAEPEIPDGPALREWLKGRMFDLKAGENRGMVGLRGAFLALLAAAGIGILATPMRGPALMASFIHWIDLPFHEAGHFVFSPFGTFVHILGGTLGQLLVPFIVAAAFLKEENPYGASVGIWWLGQSFIDCAPYIADARARVLMLISGETGQEDWEGHDWYQLLSRTGTLAHDLTIARLFWLTGALLMVAALAWGGWILWRPWQPGPEGE
jgi:hypothetical protein